MTRPSHAALVEEVAKAIKNGILAVRPSDPDPCLDAGYAEIVSLSEDRARLILSLIASRLSDVTPEMVEAICGLRPGASNYHDYEALATKKWLAGLAASPLAAGKDSP